MLEPPSGPDMNVYMPGAANGRMAYLMCLGPGTVLLGKTGAVNNIYDTVGGTGPTAGRSMSRYNSAQLIYSTYDNSWYMQGNNF